MHNFINLNLNAGSKINTTDVLFRCLIFLNLSEVSYATFSISWTIMSDGPKMLKFEISLKF